MMKKSSLLLFLTLLVAFLLPGILSSSASLRAADTSGATSSYKGDFYIISSMNLKNHEIFLKAPTEVTELMQVNDQTVLLNQQGKRITFDDLRAGNTVYVVARPSSNGERVAASIQMGPMTRAILLQRYQKL